MNNLRKFRRQIRANHETKKLRPGEDVVKGEQLPEKGRINAYRCGTCDQYTVVIHADKGVTPSMLGCRVTEGCTGHGMSIGYPEGPPPPKFLKAVKFEWYRPTWEDEILNVPGMREHIIAGGLALREVEQTEETE